MEAGSGDYIACIIHFLKYQDTGFLWPLFSRIRTES